MSPNLDKKLQPRAGRSTNGFPLIDPSCKFLAKDWIQEGTPNLALTQVEKVAV
jgi:hypothetical protein